jgi:hypothetical protein
VLHELRAAIREIQAFIVTGVKKVAVRIVLKRMAVAVETAMVTAGDRTVKTAARVDGRAAVESTTVVNRITSAVESSSAKAAAGMNRITSAVESSSAKATATTVESVDLHFSGWVGGVCRLSGGCRFGECRGGS